MPSSRIRNIKETGWNIYKPGAWEKFKEATKRKAENVAEIVRDEKLSEEEVMTKVDKIEDKIKREVFCKTKIKKPKYIETKPESKDEQKNEETEAKEISLKTLKRM